MRTLLGGERASAQASRLTHYLKLEVENGSGSWIDVGGLLGGDYLVEGGWSESIDQPVSTATFSLRRRTTVTRSLAPLMTLSALNVDDNGFYAPLLDIGRKVRASTATLDPDKLLSASDWREGFKGRIDSVEWQSEPITIACSDEGAWLNDTQIEVDAIQYGTTPVGTALEAVIQGILNATPSGKGTPTLYVPTSPGYAVTNWRQGRTKVLDAVRSIAQQATGWDVRYRYDAAHVSRLTLWNPDRTRTTVDTTIGPTEYRAVTRLALSLADVRNAGVVSYTDAAGVSHSVSSTDFISQTKYGRRYFELGSSDVLTTSTQAQTLIDTAVHDLSGAPAEQEIETLFLWFVQLYDRYTFTANNVHYDQDQTLAVVGYTHHFADGVGVTTLRCTGRVIGAYADWLRGITVKTAQRDIYNQVLATVTASDATTVTVRVDATALAGTPTVELVGVTGGATRASGPAVGVASPSGQVWVFNRGAVGGGFGQAQFRAVYAGNVDDYDAVTIPAIGDTSTVYLQARARVTASDATTVTVRLAVANPSPGATATISYQGVGVAGVTPSSGGTVTPAGSFTEAAGTYIDYVITKPAFGTGTGRVTFTATSTGYVPDTDSVDVPPVDRDTVPPTLVVTPTAESATTKTFTAAATNPTGGAAPTVTVTMRGTTATDQFAGVYTDGSTNPFASFLILTVNRPAFGTTTQASILVTASIAGGGTVTQPIEIANQVKTSFGPSLQVSVTESSTAAAIYWSTANGATVELSIDNGTWGTPGTSPIPVTRDTSNHTYAFRATLDGETVPGTALVHALPTSAPGSGDTTAVVERAWISAEDYTANTVTLSWDYSGSRGSGSFEVLRIRTPSTSADLSGTPTSIGASTGTSIVDSVPDDIQSTTGPKVTYSYFIRVRDVSAVTIGGFGWTSVTYSHA